MNGVWRHFVIRRIQEYIVKLLVFILINKVSDNESIVLILIYLAYIWKYIEYYPKLQNTHHWFDPVMAIGSIQ